MNRLASSLLLSAAILIQPLYAQTPAPTNQDLQLRIQVLSDTSGANVIPYIHDLVAHLRAHWLPLMTDEAPRSPAKQDDTIISFTIAPDGHLQSMHLVNSTHDNGLNIAAWNSIKETPYTATPSGMKDPNLILTVRFMVNETPDHP
jgi:hypothetical protein